MYVYGYTSAKPSYQTKKSDLQSAETANPVTNQVQVVLSPTSKMTTQIRPKLKRQKCVSREPKTIIRKLNEIDWAYNCGNYGSG